MLSLVQIGWADLDFFYFSPKLPHHSKLYETTEGGKCRPRFGDQIELDQNLIDWMVEEDKKSLDKIVEGNAEGFWNSVMQDGNRRHVCGLSATYSLLRLLKGKPGNRLDYGYAADPAGGYVSYAGLVF